jgi:poly(3-hydroxybutyrate) depolymerase
MRYVAFTVVASLVGTCALVMAACSSDSSSLGPGGGASSGGSSGGSADGADLPLEDGGSGTATDAKPGTTTDGATGPSTGPDKPSCKYTAHKTGLTQLQEAGGLSFNVYAPASYDPKVGHTVVVIMHGQDSNGVPELTALWKPIADTAGETLVLVAPKGSRASTNGDATVGNWATADLNEVQTIMGLVDDCYNVFPKKHILWGFSEGAFYGYLLGIGASDAFSGLAMGGANTSFARQNGYPPSASTWKIPVSDVHGDMDMNAISLTLQDRTDFQAAGHVFTLHEHPGGHSITAAQVRTQYDDLIGSTSP